jgi:hypothetical protein
VGGKKTEVRVERVLYWQHGGALGVSRAVANPCVAKIYSPSRQRTKENEREEVGECEWRMLSSAPTCVVLDTPPHYLLCASIYIYRLAAADGELLVSFWNAREKGRRVADTLAPGSRSEFGVE